MNTPDELVLCINGKRMGTCPKNSRTWKTQSRIAADRKLEKSDANPSRMTTGRLLKHLGSKRVESLDHCWSSFQQSHQKVQKNLRGDLLKLGGA